MPLQIQCRRVDRLADVTATTAGSTFFVTPTPACADFKAGTFLAVLFPVGAGCASVMAAVAREGGTAVGAALLFATLQWETHAVWLP